MTRKWRVGVLAIAFACWVTPGKGAGPVTFDFEGVGLGTFTPFAHARGGVTARFAVLSGPGYSVQNEGATFLKLSRFSGNYLYPNEATVAPLTILFSEPIDSITLTFATVEQHIASSMRLSAFLGATDVGTTTRSGAYIPGDAYPQGTVTFSAAAFDRVVLSVPLEGTEPAVAFLVDTITIDTVGPPAPVLQANWPFDEGEGQTATDTVGSYVGQLGSTVDADVNDPEWTPGRTGSGLTLSGAHFVEVPTAPALSPATITVEAWVRSPFAQTIHGYLVSKGANATCSKGAYGLRVGTTGGLEFVVSGSEGGELVSPEAPAAIWDGLWHFAAGTFDGTTSRVFVDGVEIGAGTSVSAAFPIDYSAPDQRLAIGSYLGGSCGPATLSFMGDIDQVGIWTGALSAAAVAQRFAETNLPFATDTTLAAQPAGTSHAGAPVELTAIVWSNNGPPNGDVEFRDGEIPLGTVTLTGGLARLSTTALGIGDHALSASFTPTGLFESSVSAPLIHTVVPVAPSATETTLVSEPNPSEGNAPVTLTSTVTSSGGVPTGTVEFLDGATSLGTSTLTNGVAQVTVTTLTVGSHPLTASFTPSGAFEPSVSAPVVHTVNAPVPSPTVTTLVSTPSSSVYAQPITVAATVTATSGSPGGSVQFFNGTTPLGAVALSGGVASLALANLGAGTHQLRADYLGNAEFAPSNAALSHVVLKANTATSLAISPTADHRYTLSATVAMVAPATGIPSGDVSFYDGTTLLGTVPLTTGQAVLTTGTLPVGVHTLTARYAGTPDVNASGSDPRTVTVDRFATLTLPVSSGNPLELLRNNVGVTYTASVAAIDPNAGLPTGHVSFYEDGALIGTKKLHHGSAVLNVKYRTAGLRTITAVYAGSEKFSDSESAALIQDVIQR